MNIEQVLKGCCGTTLEPGEKQAIIDYVRGLEAQVEAARSLYVRLTNNAVATDNGGICYVADNNLMTEFNAWNDATPQHHLREVRADAGLDGFIACLDYLEQYNCFGDHYKKDLSAADQYADSIRAGKDGE